MCIVVSVGREGPANKRRPPGGAGGQKGEPMALSDIIAISSLITTVVMGLPGAILAIIQIRDALKPGKGHQRPRQRSREHRRR